MTYSQIVKEELCSAKFTCNACNEAFIYAMLVFRNSEEPGVLFQSDNPHIIELLAQKIVEMTAVIAVTDHGKEPVKGMTSRKKHSVFRLSVEPTDDVAQFYEMFSKALYFCFDPKLFQKPCCYAAFLRGAFLASGVLVNPEKEYHFEFKIHHETLADKLYDFLQTTGLPFKYGIRKGNYIIYLKGSEPIEEMLTLMGAYKNALDLMNIKIVKDVRNKVNRVTNCETANIEKTVKASMKQVDDIRFIIKRKRLSYLSSDLQEVARVRLAHPDSSLSELCAMMEAPLSRSGLNHRFNKLSKVAAELRTEK